MIASDKLIQEINRHIDVNFYDANNEVEKLNQMLKEMKSILKHRLTTKFTLFETNAAKIRIMIADLHEIGVNTVEIEQILKSYKAQYVKMKKKIIKPKLESAKTIIDATKLENNQENCKNKEIILAKSKKKTFKNSINLETFSGIGATLLFTFIGLAIMWNWDIRLLLVLLVIACIFAFIYLVSIIYTIIKKKWKKGNSRNITKIPRIKTVQQEENLNDR